MEHHAYFAEGSLSDLNRVAVEASHRLDVKIKGNADVVVLSFASFGIDDARDLKTLAGLVPVYGKKLFVIGAAAMTSDAQNALLKLFEEPTPRTYFVLLVPHGALLPTLRSRCLRFDIVLHDAPEERKKAQAFIQGTYAMRSAQIERLLKNKEREEVRNFLNALEAVVYETKGDRTQALADIARMRQYAGDRAPSLKMLLEHLATTLPAP